MEIYLDKRAVQQIRNSAADAIEEGDVEALKDDIHEAFPEARVVALEQMRGGDDFMDILAAILEDWSGDDVDELFELLETQLGDHGVDLSYYSIEDDQDFDDEDDFQALTDKDDEKPDLDDEL